MKAMYWTSRKISGGGVLLVAALTIGGYALVEAFPRRIERPYHAEKVAAAERAGEAMQALRRERLRRGIPIEPEFDPAESGMIGTDVTPVTSVAGHIESKQTSVNPNFAAVIVDMLVECGVEPGDTIAIGQSGSFPALNLCLACAADALDVETIAVSSSTGSQFGANIPEWLWIDMERHLHDRGLIAKRSVAASLGGYEDRAEGLTDHGRELLRRALERNELPLVESATFGDGIDARMAIYRHHAGDRPIKAYVNVGGGTISVGRSLGKRLYEPGVNVDPSRTATMVDSVMTRFAKEGVPVVHLSQITQLAKRYGLTYVPQELEPVGKASVYATETHDRRLAGGVLAVVVAAGYLVTRRRRVEDAVAADEDEAEEAEVRLAA